MIAVEHVRLAELCAATSSFADMSTGQPAEHGLRTCLVAMRLADSLGVGADVCGEVFYVSLLRFLGCTADAHLMAELAGGDEVAFLAGMAPVAMGSPREELGRMIRHVAAGQRLPQRLRALARALTNSKGAERLLQTHCEVAARLAAEMGLPAGVSRALEMAYARWDGRGVPSDVSGTEIAMSVRVAIVARDLELWAREADDHTARQTLMGRRGHAYDPVVVDAALEVGIAALRVCDEDLWEQVLTLEPTPRTTLSSAALDRALGALGDFADLKLPERAGYSRRVARTVSAAAKVAGLDDANTKTVVRAALVHDLGMVAVPVPVWREQPRPSSMAWEQIRLHPYWSERTLARCSGLEPVAKVAGRHHERLDGSGYPSGMTGEQGQPWGLLACAVTLDELASTTGADSQHYTAQVAGELAALAAGGALDQRDVAAVLTAIGQTAPLVMVARPAGLTEREVEVIGLLAHGNTNRQIAETLGVSVKTVGAHIEHIYIKAGVRSRAAATLFAMQHDLVS